MQALLKATIDNANDAALVAFADAALQRLVTLAKDGRQAPPCPITACRRDAHKTAAARSKTGAPLGSNPCRGLGVRVIVQAVVQARSVVLSRLGRLVPKGTPLC